MEGSHPALDDYFPHLAERKIMLAPGHVGGAGEGAVAIEAPGIYNEETINSYLVADTLSVLEHTASTPYYCAGPFALKATRAMAIKPDAFIEVHCNAFKESTIHGYEVWHYGDADSEALAKNIAKRMQSYTPIYCRGVKDMRVLAQPRDDWKKKHNALFRKVPYRPLVLLECGFLTNPVDARWLEDYAHHELIASAIVHGLNDFFSPKDNGSDDAGTTGGSKPNSPA